MSLMDNPKSSSEILRDLLRRMSYDHPEIDLYPGAMAHSILKACSEEMADFYNLLTAENVMSVLPTALGRHLDLIGQLFACKRLSNDPTYPSTSNYILSLPAGMTGNDFGGSFVVPASTRLTTDPNLGDVIEYQTTHAAVFGPADNSVSVGIRAMRAGPASNIQANTITRVFFPSAPLSGTNPTAISNGTAAESDDNYRYRISQQVLALEGANSTRIRLAALTVPGVRDVILKPFVKGPGSFLIYVVSNDFGEGSPVIQEVERVVETVQNVGTYTMVLSPEPRDVRLGLFLTMRNPEQQFVDQNTRLSTLAAVRGLFDSYMPGDALDLGMISREVEDAASAVRRATVNAIELDGRQALLKNHTPYWDQRWRLVGVDIV